MNVTLVLVLETTLMGLKIYSQVVPAINSSGPSSRSLHSSTTEELDGIAEGVLDSATMKPLFGDTDGSSDKSRVTFLMVGVARLSAAGPADGSSETSSFTVFKVGVAT